MGIFVYLYRLNMYRVTLKTVFMWIEQTVKQYCHMIITFISRDKPS